MSAIYTFSKLIYFDTNILSHLANHQELWHRLFQYCSDNDLALAVTNAQLVELHDADRLYDKLIALFLNAPSVLIKPVEMIREMETTVHPSTVSPDSILLVSLNSLLEKPDGPTQFRTFLASDGLATGRGSQRQHAKRMPQVLDERKKNFPPSKTGLYTRHQADKFVRLTMRQWLSQSNASFLNRYKNNFDALNIETFRSIRLYGYVIFYKYYLGQRKPKKPSDFGDLAHSLYLPYCEVVVIERDLCNVLNQIKQNHNVLDSTKLYDIDFFKGW